MNLDISKLKVAIVTDSMYLPGGSDRLIASIIKAFPMSELFTSMYFKEKYEQSWLLPSVKVNESFLGKLPFKRLIYRFLNLLHPSAFENFDLRGFDLVLSVSAGASKGVITGVDQPHIALILTPPRFLWGNESNLRGAGLLAKLKFTLPFIRTFLRSWDQIAIKRADLVISISKYVAAQVKKVYRVDSKVIYPGISDERLKPVAKPNTLSIVLPDKYFVIVSRLYQYKQIDWAIKACIEAGENLIIIGDGPDMKSLRKLASGHKNIEFLGSMPDLEVRYIMANAQAFLFCGIEDYGLTPVEAMASGTPVLAYNQGGVTETVIDGITGRFFNNYDELVALIKDFSKFDFEQSKIIANAKRFTESVFTKELKSLITEFYANRK